MVRPLFLLSPIPPYSRTLAVPTANDLALFRAGWQLFESGPWTGKAVRLIGLGLSGWEATMTLQLDLFGRDAPEPDREEERLEATLDAIRDRFGRGTIQRGLPRRLAEHKGAAGSEGD